VAYQPIEDYGVIGDLHTVALVCKNGSIDWLCFPHFDSPSVFAAILDDEKGGRFQIAPAIESFTDKQIYWPETNILITRFLSPDGVGEIIDYMPVNHAATGDVHNRLIRQVKVVRGAMPFRMQCLPAFNYARDEHELRLTGSGATFTSPSLSLGLATRLALERRGGGVIADFTLKEGEEAVFVLREISAGSDCGPSLDARESEALFKQTISYWREWLSKCSYHGRWREMVHRSALVLKLLTFQPTGAIVAAPTCGLPEVIGGERNWDYRYTWFRDAAFTLYGLLRIGFTEEAAHFMHWLEARCREPNPDGSLQIVYSIDGRHDLREQTLDHLSGYKGSRPVRIGNGAHNQLQLDIYGELMDSVYLFNKHGAPISYDLWTHLRRLNNWVCDNWQRKDEGIWEVRSGKQHFVYSKLMCWVALDRALRLAGKRSFPADHERWLETRDQIYETIMTEGWSDKRQAFVQAFGSQSLDAANLIMPLVFFVSPIDPRMLSTLDAINRSSAKGGLVTDGLVYRYDADKTEDGFDGKEGTFNMCTFWLVEALTRAGRVDRARLNDARYMFEQMLGYANHLGLYAEETGLSGEALGNFPQAFTHLALISAAFNLDRALDERP
jgi:GH15 family glucan-1,4-alpha-glucosidase